MYRCNHCDFEFESPYCPNCGMKHYPEKLTLTELNSFLVSEVFTLESKLFRTLIDLFIRPHIVTLKFLNGDRQTYYNPIKYFILFGAFSIFLRYILNFDEIFTQLSTDFQSVSSNTTTNQSFDVGRKISRNINNYSFILVFIFALLTKLFNWKSKFTLIDLFVFSFYVIGQTLLMSSIITILMMINPYFFVLNNFIVVPYCVYTLIKLYDRRNLSQILKHILTSVLTYFTFFIFLSIIIILFIR
jgi:hypothetical protein